MNEIAQRFLDELLEANIEKDIKVTIKDIESIQNKYKKDGVIFPKELIDFYIKYNQVIKYNIYFKDVINVNDDEWILPRINLQPLISKISNVTVNWTLEMVLYYENEREYLEGLIPIGLDDGGAIVCYKIDDGKIIEYLDDLEDENDYEVVANSFEELFEYLDLKNEIK